MALDVYKDWLGIPDDVPRPVDLYSLLRLVKFNDDAEKARSNYKKLNAHVRKYASGTYQVQSQELLNELAKAMLCLTDPERKRDYDESLGRTFEDDDNRENPTIAETLVRWDVVTREQMQEARDFAERRGLEMRDAVVQMKLVDAEQATKALAAELGFPYVDLEELTPDNSVLDKVPQNLARRNTILPLFVDDNMLLVACGQEPSHDLEDDLRFRFGVPMRRVIASPASINEGVVRYYEELEAVKAEVGSDADEKADETADEKADEKAKTKKKKKKKTVVDPDSDEAKEAAYKRNQIGKILMCWSVIVPVVIDHLVLPDRLKFFSIFGFSLSLVISPVLMYLVWGKFFRRS